MLAFESETEKNTAKITGNAFNHKIHEDIHYTFEVNEIYNLHMNINTHR